MPGISFSVQAFRLALEHCGGSAETTVFLDDSSRNVAAARAMGIFSVQVSSRGSDTQQNRHA